MDRKVRKCTRVRVHPKDKHASPVGLFDKLPLEMVFNFAIGPKDLKAIPIIYPLAARQLDYPRSFQIGFTYWQNRPEQRMVDVARARDLAIKLHGNENAMKRASRARRKERETMVKDAWESYTYQWESYTDQRSPKRRFPPRFRTIPTDLVYGPEALYWIQLATIAFPHWDGRAGN